MAFFRDKNGDWNFDVLLWLAVFFALLVKGISPPSVLVLVGSSVCLFIAIGKGCQHRWADWLGFLMLLSALAMSLHLLVLSGFAAKYFLLVAVTAFGVWNIWTEDIQRPAVSTSSDPEPLISLVLLLRQPRYLEERILAHIVESAWGGDYTHEDESHRDGFVVGSDTIYLVKSPMGMFSVNNFPLPYWREPASVAESVPDLRLRKIVTDHQAWLSVDLLAADDSDNDHAVAYAAIIRLIHDLADDTVLGILRPETGRVSEWSDDVLDALLKPDGHERFHQAGNVPVLQVSSDDPEMKAAVEEARRRWPEFLAAFEQRKPSDQFSVKAPVTVNGVTEFIWITVQGLEPDFVHGRLANEPVDLGDLRLGSLVEVPVKEVNDWAISQGDHMPTGLFTVGVVTSRQHKSSS